MEVEEPGVRLPAAREATYAIVVERSPQLHPPREVGARADVVAGEHRQSTEPAQQHVLGGPAADAVQADEPFDRGGIVEVGERVEIESVLARARELEQGARLRVVEAGGAQLRRPERREVVRARERDRTARGAQTAPGREPVEQQQPDRQAQLLARDAVDERLEHARKPRRLETAEASDQGREMAIGARHPVERREIDGQPEHALERCADRRSSGCRRASGANLEDRTAGVAALGDLDIERALADDDRPRVRVTVPAIDRVGRTPAQRPRREIEPERRDRMERERQRHGGGRAAGMPLDPHGTPGETR